MTKWFKTVWRSMGRDKPDLQPCPAYEADISKPSAIKATGRYGLVHPNGDLLREVTRAEHLKLMRYASDPHNPLHGDWVARALGEEEAA